MPVRAEELRTSSKPFEVHDEAFKCNHKPLALLVIKYVMYGSQQPAAETNPSATVGKTVSEQELVTLCGSRFRSRVVA
jgi:hypothetical protein